MQKSVVLDERQQMYLHLLQTVLHQTSAGVLRMGIDALVEKYLSPETIGWVESRYPTQEDVVNEQALSP